MKTLYLAVALVSSGAAAAADTVEGVWQTLPGEDGTRAHVEIAQCGSTLCGTIVDVIGTSGQSVGGETLGEEILWGMLPKGDGKYAGGKIRDPQNGKVYKSKLALKGAGLKVSGCIGPVCAGQVWERVK